MNTKIKVSRIVIALLLTVSALGVSTSAALADKPAKYEFSFSAYSELTDVCPFTVGIDIVGNVTAIDFFDNSGALIRSNWHLVEQDTFSANGKSLAGIPYTVNLEWFYDSGGNVTSNIGVGVYEKVPLPDGSLFISAGRADFVDHPGVNFLLSPDKGNSGNVEAFCAALAP